MMTTHEVNAVEACSGIEMILKKFPDGGIYIETTEQGTSYVCGVYTDLEPAEGEQLLLGSGKTPTTALLSLAQRIEDTDNSYAY